MSEIRKLRCAVYTRKSSEEGLDQSFNSLDAQREACVAYIASQASLGWRLVSEPYDDGGISGGTLERPGIQRLLQDIRDGKVDVVVVAQLNKLFRNRSQLTHWIEQYGKARDLIEQLQSAAKLEELIGADRTGNLRNAIVKTVFRRITLASDWLRYDVDAKRLIDVISGHTQYPDVEAITQAIIKSERGREQNANDSTSIVEISEKITLKRRGVEMRIVVDDRTSTSVAIDQTLVDMIARAHIAISALTDRSKRSIADVAQSMDIDASDLSRILPLAFVSPKLTEAILTGHQPPDLTLRKLTRGIELPIEWARQNELLAG